MGLYISRGPFSGDPGSSEFAPYLSKQTLTQIKKFLMNSREIDSNLESVTDARFVSVGGTQNEINDDLVINEGDQVLHATVDDNSLDNIYAQQTVSSVVGSNVSKSTRQDLASLIWSEKDAKNACSLWFSIIPVINLNGAYSYTSAQNVCEQSREMIPDSLSWQEDDLYIIPEAADDENQKPADLLKSVGGWSTSGTRYTQQEAFILQVESDESQRYTKSLKFDENIIEYGDEDDLAILCTDQYSIYDGIDEHNEIDDHLAINYDDHYVVGDAHTNSCENRHTFLRNWLRRFRGVSTHHLQGYLNFFSLTLNTGRWFEEIISTYFYI